MPVVLRVKGYRFWCYEVDLDEPPHGHVGKEGKEAKYWIDPIALAKSGGFEDMNSMRLKGFWWNTRVTSWRHGERSNKNVLTVKAKVKTQSHEFVPIVPIVIPDLDEVRKLAAKLHAARKTWKGEAEPVEFLDDQNILETISFAKNDIGH